MKEQVFYNSVKSCSGFVMMTDLERVECLSSPRLTCPLAQALAAGGPPSVTTHYLLVTSTLDHPLSKTLLTLFQKVVSSTFLDSRLWC